MGGITKGLMTKYGIPPNVWGAHSTRGAGVLLYKKLGLTSEEVCEIGKWKNVQAFHAHYLRLGAPQEASQKICDLVHNTSPEMSAEPDLSRTPLKKCFEKGGRDKEGKARRDAEVTLLLPANCSRLEKFICTWLRWPPRC